MKVRIEIEEDMKEPEVVIRCASLDESIIRLQQKIADSTPGQECLALTKDDTEYYVPLTEILFFETEGNKVLAHTSEKIFSCGYKLYELEDFLPGSFMRASKCAILNLDKIYSITRNLTASSIVEFIGTNKKAAVSRNYYKMLTDAIQDRRMGTNKKREER